MFATPERAGAGSESREEKPATTQAMRRVNQGRKTAISKSKASWPCFFVCAYAAEIMERPPKPSHHGHAYFNPTLYS